MISSGARVSSPSRITEPLPNCRSMLARAASRAFSRSPPAMSFRPIRAVGVARFEVFVFVVVIVLRTLDLTADRTGPGPEPGDDVDQRARLWTQSSPNTCSTRSPPCRRVGPGLLGTSGAAFDEREECRSGDGVGCPGGGDGRRGLRRVVAVRAAAR